MAARRQYVKCPPTTGAVSLRAEAGRPPQLAAVAALAVRRPVCDYLGIGRELDGKLVFFEVPGRELSVRPLSIEDTVADVPAHDRGPACDQGWDLAGGDRVVVRHLSYAAALAELDRLRPGIEDLVVCHGDYCLPNVMISGGEVAGFVDLGELCVADRWRDLAVATWSVTWNLGPGFEDLFLASYGIERNEEAQTFYRLLVVLAQSPTCCV